MLANHWQSSGKKIPPLQLTYRPGNPLFPLQNQTRPSPVNVHEKRYCERYALAIN